MSNEVLFAQMNDFYSISEENHVSEKCDKKEKRTQVLKILVIIFAILILAEALVYLVLMPCLAPAKIVYSGLESFSAQQVNQYLQISPKTTWIGFDSAKVATKLVSNIVIEDVVIEKHFPDMIKINVKERKAAAITLANVKGKTVPVQIDKNGVIFAVGRGFPKENVPLVTGFTFDSISEGMRLNAKLRPLMQEISDIYAKNPAYFSEISEIRVVAKDYGNYELELYPVNSYVKVLVDRNLNEQTLQYMMVMLDVLDKFPTDVSVVDLRYGSISYR